MADDQKARFQSEDDPKYLQLLDIQQRAKRALDATPRIDMPGAKPIIQERNFGRTF